MNRSHKKNMTGVILAGGMGRRLGQSKTQVQVEGQALIKRVLEALRPLFDELLIIGGDQSQAVHDSGVKRLTDVIPKKGSLGGIYSGLCYTAASRIFCFACDMPFLDAGLIKHMINNAASQDVLIPQFDGELHPLHAIYSQACREPITQQLDMDELKIINFFSRVKVNYVTAEEIRRLNPGGYCLFNINTRQDLHNARKIAKRIRH